MANPDLEPGALFKWNQVSRVDAQLEQQHELEHTQRAVYRQVTERDGHRCRVCAMWCDSSPLTLVTAGHHHHVVYLSAGGATSVENVVLLCARCHNDVHHHRLDVEGNANGDPWLTVKRKDKDGQWYVWRQERGVREYERD